MNRRGFILLEVVIGLVLLATVLVTSLLALGKQRRILRQANDRQQAISLADAFLTKWHQSTTGVPLWGSGPIVERAGWWWQTEVVANRLIFGKTRPIVRLQIIDRNSNSAKESVLISIELLHQT